jgi:hypothetical protein
VEQQDIGVRKLPQVDEAWFDLFDCDHADAGEA